MIRATPCPSLARVVASIMLLVWIRVGIRTRDFLPVSTLIISTWLGSLIRLIPIILSLAKSFGSVNFSFWRKKCGEATSSWRTSVKGNADKLLSLRFGDIRRAISIRSSIKSTYWLSASKWMVKSSCAEIQVDSAGKIWFTPNSGVVAMRKFPANSSRNWLTRIRPCSAAATTSLALS